MPGRQRLPEPRQRRRSTANAQLSVLREHTPPPIAPATPNFARPRHVISVLFVAGSLVFANTAPPASLLASNAGPPPHTKPAASPLIYQQFRYRIPDGGPLHENHPAQHPLPRQNRIRRRRNLLHNHHR